MHATTDSGRARVPPRPARLPIARRERCACAAMCTQTHGERPACVGNGTRKEFYEHTCTDRAFRPRTVLVLLSTVRRRASSTQRVFEPSLIVEGVCEAGRPRHTDHSTHMARIHEWSIGSAAVQRSSARHEPHPPSSLPSKLMQVSRNGGHMPLVRYSLPMMAAKAAKDPIARIGMMRSGFLLSVAPQSLSSERVDGAAGSGSRRASRVAASSSVLSPVITLPRCRDACMGCDDPKCGRVMPPTATPNACAGAAHRQSSAIRAIAIRRPSRTGAARLQSR